ncbi:hypothetical protein ACFWBN_24500 [Streptomyces sp. NPDC059989]|uniref:hypothetical protein n=1 Tax=Streptomyces sp. NPDC059989 TaxID=3347026 RepID=UPI00368E5988
MNLKEIADLGQGLGALASAVVALIVVPATAVIGIKQAKAVIAAGQDTATATAKAGQENAEAVYKAAVDGMHLQSRGVHQQWLKENRAQTWVLFLQAIDDMAKFPHESPEESEEHLDALARAYSVLEIGAPLGDHPVVEAAKAVMKAADDLDAERGWAAVYRSATDLMREHTPSEEQLEVAEYELEAHQAAEDHEAQMEGREPGRVLSRPLAVHEATQGLDRLRRGGDTVDTTLKDKVQRHLDDCTFLDDEERRVLLEDATERPRRSRTQPGRARATLRFKRRAFVEAAKNELNGQ